jgi:hypothetical protein
MPPYWANARGGHIVQPHMGLAATPPHPYEFLEPLVGPQPHRQEIFCLSIKNLGQVDIFP